MTLPRTSPIEFCKAFIARDLAENKEKNIWMSYWPVMARLIARASELEKAFNEIIENFGYTDKRNAYLPEHSYVWLTLEHIWMSIDYRRTDVSDTRDDFNELKALKEQIVGLSEELAEALSRQEDLYETSGFHREEYQSSYDLIAQASEGNGLYEMYLSPELEALHQQFDLKYWPSRSDIVLGISDFERRQAKPYHTELPESVINGRASDIKDFVLTFDSRFDGSNGLPAGFKFTNRALAEIINIVLDLQPDKLVSPEAVKLVRNRYSKIMEAQS